MLSLPAAIIRFSPQEETNMKMQFPVSLLTLLLLAACGGGGGSDNAPQADKNPPPAPVPDNKPANPPAAQPDVSLSNIMLPPRRAARPDAETQAKINEALAATNQLRAAQGLALLRNDETLAAYATIRAQELAGQGEKIDHKRANGANPLADQNFIGRDGIAENIGADKNGSAASIVKAWRDSPHHYQTIISGEFQNIGIGYHYDANSVWKNYWTQIFSGGGTRSIYSFITPIDRAAALAAVRAAVQYDNAGRLTLNAPRERTDSTDTSGISRNAHTLALGNEHRITLLPLQTAGWSYQTFGEISDNHGIPEAYFNVGKPFVPADGAELHADYRGSAVGDLGQHDRVRADVSARLDYGSSSKTLNLKVDKAMRSNGFDLADSTAKRDLHLDFEDTLNWNAAAQRFESDSGNARLYGNGEELGGQFNRIVGKEAYRGVYGAKRVD